ncbi:XRE family transcriptional regulator [Seonamhaeicola sp. S2-3]|uniref:XRE family transcriptional regulator n=1 Tax=Seonamhaeicola sp. S2-3 TaxID=1936081 RepID=UPI000972C9A7|nr:LexA family transcriptional regulator [Seonamhaeicola sp. S2-3]APY10480.1 XRE family transcriptional regulator [Seonamhaeicola sp. S2-3]
MNFIPKNIRHLRDLKGLSQEQLAEELGISRSNLGSKEEGRSEPNLALLVTLSDFFKIPVDILIKKDLTKTKDFSFIDLGNQRVLFPIMVDSENEDLIEVVPVKTSAGYLAGYDDPEYIEQLEKIKLPFLPSGKHRAFPIKGDSMLPMKNGSFIVGRYVEDMADIKNGTTYVLLTKNDGMVYKRVFDQLHSKGTLLLVSDNREYRPYEIKADEVLELWEFTCAIQTQEYSPDELKISSILQMFNALGVELEALKR